jgi:uncharacterized membrane protein YesL
VAVLGFLVKKAFFDLWDNLLRIVLLNLGYVAVLSLAYLSYYPLQLLSFIPERILFFLALFLDLGILLVYTGAVSGMAKEISDYKEPGFRDFARFLKSSWPNSLLFALINAVLIFLLTAAMPFYLGIKSFFGPLAFAFLLWSSFIWLAACQYFFPLYSRLGGGLRQNLKKAFLLFFDNTAFSLVLFLGAILIFVLAALPPFLLTGLAAVSLWLNVGLKLRLLKYDYLEINPEADRKRVPWEKLLVSERERVGKRTLRGMIFPWKD